MRAPDSKITWTCRWDDDYNLVHTGYGWPVTTGCTKSSAACKNCYAEAIFKRFKKDFTPTEHPEHLTDTFPQKRIIFVSPMGDLFHPSISFDFQNKVFQRIGETPNRTFVVLTKRASGMLTYWRRHGASYPNLWVGVTAETQVDYNYRASILSEIGLGARTFISMEPLLERIKLDPRFWVDLIIVGCESGPNRRNTAIDWVSSIDTQSSEVGTRLYVKQLENYSTGKVEHLPWYWRSPYMEMDEWPAQ